MKTLNRKTARTIRLEDLLSKSDIRSCYEVWEIATCLQPTIIELFRDYVERHPKFYRARERKMKRRIERRRKLIVAAT